MGNEPDILPAYVNPNSRYGCWGNQDDQYYGGTYYAEMLKVVYPQIKAADPDAQVLIGGLLMDCDPNNPPVQSSGQPKDCQPSYFLEGILENGGGDYFDGISFHAYDYYWIDGSKFINGWRAGLNGGLPVVYYKTAFLRALLTQYGYPDKLLLNTETALLCGNDQGEAVCRTDEYHQTKANYVAQSYAVARGEYLQANVWYHYQEGWRASGLVQSPSNPYPALSAYRFAAQMLKDTIPLEFIQDYPNVVGYKFLKSTSEGLQEIWVLWAADGVSSTIILPELPNQLFDVLGQDLSPSQTLDITTNVLYLVWNR
ncbi:MAG TPA: hypothetical protein PK530_01905 [Anaerolineales bacterium]|nr:hypothetical protein [Anaerolineales bacterium]